jgi:hypothetical protein
MKTIVAGCIVVVQAADPFYIGQWKLSGAVAAPWADPQRKPSDAERGRLLGKTIAIRSREIAGPDPFACRGPHYKVSQFTADMVFQGAFETMQSNDKAVDPAKLAASLGFSPGTIKTLSRPSRPAARSTFTLSTTPPRRSASTTMSIRSRNSRDRDARPVAEARRAG